MSNVSVKSELATRLPAAEPSPCGAPIVVVLVISNLEFGGAERQVVELANHLDPANFAVHLVSLADYVPLADRLDPARVTLHRMGKTRKYDLGIVVRLARLLRRVRADVVHTFLFDADIAGRLAGRLAGVPVMIGSERNADYQLPQLKRWLYRITAPLLDLCIANSTAGAKYNARLLRQPDSHYSVIYNGVDTRRFRPRDAQPVRAELGIAAQQFVVGIFGSFKAQKNHRLFFRIAAQVIEAGIDACFLVVGDNLEGGRRASYAYKQEILALVESLDVAGHCRFLGNREDVELLYPACDVTLLPSLHEGTPNVALESMASGVPVVVSDVSDNRIVVPENRVGHVISLDREAEFTARICAMARDRQRCRQFGLTARTWVDSEFSNEKLAARHAEIYASLLTKKRLRKDRSVSSA